MYFSVVRELEGSQGAPSKVPRKWRVRDDGILRFLEGSWHSTTALAGGRSDLRVLSKLNKAMLWHGPASARRLSGFLSISRGIHH